MSMYLFLFLLCFSGKPSTLYDATNPDWAPTVKMGHGKVDQQSTRHVVDRYKRSQGRVVKKQRVDATKALLQLQTEEAIDEQTTCEVPTQTDMDASTVCGIESELRRMVVEVADLKEKLRVEHSKFNRDFFNDDNDKVRYYTGLPKYSTLEIVFGYLDEHIPHSTVSTLSKYQIMIMTMMKLRLNLSHMDLAVRFGITTSSASRLFLNMLDMMFARLKPLVYWPDREQLRETMPMSFRTHFGTEIAVIIDCFEIFLERPSNLQARALTWSSYKHNNTVKFLIGVTPQGTISFISDGWGGRTSDKHVTEHSGFLDKLLPGDLVLADRGFDIGDTVGMVGAKLAIPAFTKGKPQLSGKEVENTRRIANVRIHVERVIGCLRQKYTILGSTLPIDFVLCSHGATTLDKIVTVCCSLTNLCPSVVPFN